MALTKIITDTIDLNSNTTALKMPTGTSTSDETIQYLVVAGGGGGAGNTSGGGGGGAGGLLSGTTSVALGTNITVTIGSGGDGTVLETNTDVAGSGGNSVFSTITATGGGGAANTAATSASGGSGGGASGLQSPGGSGTSGEGNDGGIGSTPDSDIGGGGGGAGGVGQPGGTRTGATDGQGGVALANSITGTSVLYAGGGGGGACDVGDNSTPATAGLGGGGVAGTGGDGGQSQHGTTTQSVFGDSGVANTGGGGGGGSRSSSGEDCGGGDGGSGTVILRYPTVNTLTVGSGLYGNYSTGTTGLCHWPTTSNGVSLFQLDDNLTDTCGNATAAWVGASAYSTTAKFGSHSAEFSGGNGGTYIDTGVDPDSYSNWTVSFWVYRTNTAAFDMFIGSVDSSLNNGFLVSAYDEDDECRFDVYLRNAGGNVWRTQGGSVKFNTWQHIALTYDGSGSGTTTIYHNGKLLTGIILGSNPATGSFASATNWCIGSAGTWNNERLYGYIDQTRFYDSVLTAQEIELLYAETSDPTTGVIGSETWSKFLGGTGTVSFLNTGTGTGRPVSPDIGTMRENTTTGKMEIYTGTKGWRALQQTGQDVGIVPSDNFNVTQYVGDGSSIKTLTGLNFQPDLTWIKITTQTWLGTVWDSVEGVGSGKEFSLFSSGTYTAGARGSGSSGTYGYLSSLNSDGWTSTGGSSNNSNTNSSGDTYVTWNWKVGGNSNTYNKNGTGYASAADAGMDVGNITPTGSSVNTENGISIIQWTGIDTVGKTIPHGFSSAPDVVITKANTAGYGWVTFTNLFSQNTTTDYLYLNDVAAIAGASFGGTNYCTFNPTTLEVAATGGNWSYGVEQTAYCFKSTPGFSLIGRYTGTGSATNTPIIYTGFKPAWILIKNCNNNGNSWVVMDIARNTTSPFSNYLLPDYAYGTYTSAGDVVNYYDNGFQIAGTANFLNQAGNDFFFMCFAS